MALGTAEVIAGVTALSPLAPGLPTIAGLRIWSYFGVDLATSQNAVPGGPTWAHLSGAPTYGTNYVRCKNQAGALTAAAIGVEATRSVLVGCRYNVPAGSIGAAAQIFGTPAGGQPLSFSPLLTGLQTNFGGTPNPQALAVADTRVMKLYGATIGGGAVTALYDFTSNTQSLGSVAATPTPNTAGWNLGSGNVAAGSNNQEIDFSFYAEWIGTILTKPQFDAQVAGVRKVLQMKGWTSI